MLSSSHKFCVTKNKILPRVGGKNFTVINEKIELHSPTVGRGLFSRRHKTRLKSKFDRTQRLLDKKAVVNLFTSEKLAIDVNGVDVTFEDPSGDVHALKECSLTVEKGQLWMLLGSNGCGKSTLLKTLAGILTPSEGSYSINLPRSFVFQNPDHQVVMPTVASDVAFGLGKLNLPNEEIERRVAEALRAVGMETYADRSVSTLSGGQKQRVAIAGALAEKSQVLLLDELTTFLDESDQLGVLESVRKVASRKTGVTALWVTHRLEELAFADGAAYMESGKVVFSGAVEMVRMYLNQKGFKNFL